MIVFRIGATFLALMSLSQSVASGSGQISPTDVQSSQRVGFDTQCYFALQKVEKEIGNNFKSFRFAWCDLDSSEESIEIVLTKSKFAFGGLRVVLSLDDLKVQSIVNEQ